MIPYALSHRGDEPFEYLVGRREAEMVRTIPRGVEEHTGHQGHDPARNGDGGIWVHRRGAEGHRARDVDGGEIAPGLAGEDSVDVSSSVGCERAREDVGPVVCHVRGVRGEDEASEESRVPCWNAGSLIRVSSPSFRTTKAIYFFSLDFSTRQSRVISFDKSIQPQITLRTT